MNVEDFWFACFLVSQGWRADDAIREVRRQRPGSIAVEAQAGCVREYAQTVSRSFRRAGR